MRVDPEAYIWLPQGEAGTAGQHHLSARTKALSSGCTLPPDLLYPRLSTSVLLAVTMTPEAGGDGRSAPDLRMGVEFLSGSVSPLGRPALPEGVWDNQTRTIALPSGRGPRRVKVGAADRSGTGGSETSSAPAEGVVPVPIFRPPAVPPPRLAGNGEVLETGVVMDPIPTPLLRPEIQRNGTVQRNNSTRPVAALPSEEVLQGDGDPRQWDLGAPEFVPREPTTLASTSSSPRRHE